MRRIICGYAEEFGGALFAIVDEENYKELVQHNWTVGIDRRSSIPRIAHVKRYTHTNNRQTLVLMHHQIIGRPPPGYVVDHINRNVLDNRRANLKFNTHRGNSRNTIGYRGNISYGPRGYRVQINTTDKALAEYLANGLELLRLEYENNRNS